MDTRKYEMMYVVGADLGEEQLEALTQRIERYLETAQAHVYSIKSWGLRRLAYTLKGQREGRYYLAQFEAPTRTVNDLDHNVRLIEEVLRHIIIQVEKLEIPEEPEEAAQTPSAQTPSAQMPAEEMPVVGTLDEETATAGQPEEQATEGTELATEA
ncbi:MAG: 30S ribosomal protein S6 [Anaerolineae bacterium]|nr:30S ribosomal protein S6 [Anaerolineae bacterium]